MLEIGVITLFPEMLEAVTAFGVTGRAMQRGVARLSVFNPRDYTADAHRTVDDRPYGGGPGMVMLAEPVRCAIADARKAITGAPVIHLSPQGQRLTQRGAGYLAARGGLILLAGRYEGIDERLLESEVDEEWSIGDYVLSGGELPAMVMIDAMIRLLPGALGDARSSQQDSFAAGLLDYPHYTRPECYRDMPVPDALMSGDHERIRRWRLKQALGRTWRRRPDLLAALQLDDEQKDLLDEYINEQASH